MTLLLLFLRTLFSVVFCLFFFPQIISLSLSQLLSSAGVNHLEITDQALNHRLSLKIQFSFQDNY